MSLSTRRPSPGGRPLGLLPGASYATTNLELREGDTGGPVTDGITEALEAASITPEQALGATRRGQTASRSPGDICDDVLLAAAGGSGPAGAPELHDDRTVFVFSVDGTV